MIGLSVTALLWQGGRLLSSLTSFLLWIGFSVMSAIATAGFTSTSIGDHTAGRASTIEAATDQRQQRLDRIAAAKLAVTTAESDRDAECKTGDGPRCRELKAAVRTAQDKQRTALETPITASPVLGVADPGAHMLASLLHVDQAAIQKLRITGLTIAPITARIDRGNATRRAG